MQKNNMLALTVESSQPPLRPPKQPLSLRASQMPLRLRLPLLLRRHSNLSTVYICSKNLYTFTIDSCHVAFAISDIS